MVVLTQGFLLYLVHYGLFLGAIKFVCFIWFFTFVLFLE